MTLLLWLHLSAILVAFALLPGLGLVMRFIAARCEPPTVRSVFAVVGPLLNVGGGAVGIGVVTGLVLAARFGYAQPWLLGTYALTILTGVLANVIDAPWAKRLAAASGPEYDAVRRESLPAWSIYLYFVAWFAILWLNVAKPGVVPSA